jgi:hypothetical protein
LPGVSLPVHTPFSTTTFIVDFIEIPSIERYFGILKMHLQQKHAAAAYKVYASGQHQPCI